MTQWKSKLSYAHFDEPLYGNHRSKLKLGLFSYPVLQASDILVHRGTQVPVGDDQSQHLEFARDCAKTFNHQYTKVFPEPSTLLSPARRIMSLKEPNLKMSKSHRNPKSRILITDSDEEIYNNIKQALTDSISGVSYDPENRPGVSNLLDIMAYLESGSTSPYELAANFKELSMREFKERVAECVIANLSGIRARFQQIIAADEGRYVDHVAAEGAKKAHESAEATMVLVRDATGL
ncbi:MAG: Tryptophan--tRNA ligase, mitochondrial [Trizodia sp. TS-e1964]|nr:MAG: Tryptophan--tRNA ligase, mitochondrial [Trizodia sp. TS-e1964]